MMKRQQNKKKNSPARHSLYEKYNSLLQHWGIPLSRRFRSLKLWFVIRNFGVTGLQEYVRNHCRLARQFQTKVENDTRFRLMNDVKVDLERRNPEREKKLKLQVGLVCFRLFGSSQLNQKLLTTINASGKLHMVPANVNEYFVIRFCVCAQNATSEDIGELHIFPIKFPLFLKTALFA